MYKIQFNWEKEYKIVEDFDTPPRKEETYRIHAFNVPEELKNKVVALLDAELMEQLVLATKSYEQNWKLAGYDPVEMAQDIKEIKSALQNESNNS